MRQADKLYEYLYRSLVSQITCGVFPYGQKFPSQQQLCQWYNIGITTVRRVMKMLGDQGYIRTARGQAAVVTYQASPKAYAAALVRRRHEIIDGYKGLSLLMPVLYLEGAKRCRESQFREMQAAIDGIHEDLELPDLYRQADVFYRALLRLFQNQLIMELELDMEHFLHIPYISFPGVDDPFSLTADRLRSHLQQALKWIKEKQFSLFYEEIQSIYRETGKRVERYLDALSRHADAGPAPKQEQRWFRMRERSELYAHLAMQLLRRIVGGEFDGQTYLPSIPALMEEYAVMKNTVCRSLFLLNTVGVVETIDKKGTVLTMGQGEVSKKWVDFTSPVVQERLSLCLGALQIMALTTSACAASFPVVSEAGIRLIEEKLYSASHDRISPISVQILMGCFLHLSPYHSLKSVYRQLDTLMLWGYYLQSADEALYSSTDHVFSAMEAVFAALRQNNQAALPQAVENAFLQIYQDVRFVVSRLPLDADALPAPI